MGALIEITDIETALGRPAEDDQEEATWQHLINVFSDIINNYVDVLFTRVEDVTERLKADYEGVIRLLGPNVVITSILNFRTQEPDLFADWDGIDTIENLYPSQVVDVTYSAGYDTVPDDVKNLVVTGVLSQIGELSPVDLRAFKVGDVEEQYRQGNSSVLFADGLKATLGKYTRTQFTINTGGGDYLPDYNSQGFLND